MKRKEYKEKKKEKISPTAIPVAAMHFLQKQYRSDRFSGNIFFYFLFSSVDIFFFSRNFLSA